MPERASCHDLYVVFGCRANTAASHNAMFSSDAPQRPSHHTIVISTARPSATVPEPKRKPAATLRPPRRLDRLYDSRLARFGLNPSWEESFLFSVFHME